ncbi:MAG: alpha-amylase family glycosyl hydrolase [Clostridiales bacterium]|nr:alpha-amylase family glycosyl hydrolase [Clostridiales bacterium]
MKAKNILRCAAAFFLTVLLLIPLACIQGEVPETDTTPTEAPLPTAEPADWQAALATALAAHPLPDYTRPTGNGRTWYQVFVYSYYDSDGNGIGDLAGVTQSLDYIQNMGFDGIWLSPIHPSTTYHKYDVKDYYGIDPQYGTMDDFDALMAACQERGLAVLLDLVLNHSSDEHPWFRERPEYYHIEEKKGQGQWQSYPGGGYYECQFWGKMPDLNLANEELRAEFADIMRFWLEKGVAGFRLDAVKEFESGNNAFNIEVLQWVNETAKSIRPDAYLVGENWELSNLLYRYYESGLDSFFAFPFAGSEGSIVKTLTLGTSDTADYLKEIESAEKRVREAGSEIATQAPFLTNHDQARSAGLLRKDAYLIKSAWGMNLMQPGDAFVYYGEEVGMSGSGKDENKRAPMPWTNDARASGMSFGPPAMEAQTHNFGSVLAQAYDELSIFSYVRDAVRLRAKWPIIGRGNFAVLSFTADAAQMKAMALIDLPDGGGNRTGTYLGGSPSTDAVDLQRAASKVGIALRSYEGKSILIIYNLSPATANLQIADILQAVPAGFSIGGILQDLLSATGLEAYINNGTLTLPPYTIALMD